VCSSFKKNRFTGFDENDQIHPEVPVSDIPDIQVDA
jgi:hypothetical protein